MEQYKVRDNSAFDYSFVALAAPSYEGKTQSAFVMRNVRPLYFVTDSKIIESKSLTTQPQPIYDNYQSVSAALLRYAKIDYNLIETDGIPIDVPKPKDNDKDWKFFKVSGSHLDAHHSKTNFLT